MDEVADVSFRTGRRAAVRGLLGAMARPLWRGLRRGPGDFGVVVMGEPLNPQISARWIVWETTELPPAQRELCDSVRFLWTPSSWGRRNLIANGIAPERVAVVPEGVDVDFFRPQPKAGGRFRFLMVGKWEERKFCTGLLQAYTEEFGPHEDVELYLHAHNPYVRGFSLKAKVEEAGYGQAHHLVLGEPCDRAALRQLYQSADCFVMPTRAEGWGLPILEAMSCGVPPIVTRYSAPLDYVSDDNGYLLDIASLVDARDAEFGICTGQWADPDVQHLRVLMRRAFENRGELKDKGTAARQTAERFTWGHAARIALDTISRHLDHDQRAA